MISRAQAALEYLMTYGWALILIVSVASVLFFILSSNTATQPVFSSSLPTKILLKAGNISNNSVDVLLQNVTGGNISITSAVLSGSFGYSPVCLNGRPIKAEGNCNGNTVVVSGSAPLNVVSGGQMNFTGIRYSGIGNGSINIQFTDFSGAQKTVIVTGGGKSSSGSDSLLGAETNPGLSCKDILVSGASKGDGVYWIDPDSIGAIAKFLVYCDMTSDDGGWTLGIICRPEDNPNYPVYNASVPYSDCFLSTAVGELTNPTSATSAKLSDAVIRLILGNNGITRAAWFQKYRMNVETNTSLILYNKISNVSQWDSSDCGAVGKEFFKKTSYAADWGSAILTAGTGCSCAVEGWSNYQQDSCGLATWQAGCEKAPSMSHCCACQTWDERADVVLWLRAEN